MAVSGARSDKYDVLLIHRNPSRRQFKWLQSRAVPFVYDIDDLMLADDVRGGRRVAEQQSISWCLEHAHAVTAPSRRLLAALNHALAGGLGTRAVYLANAGLPQPPARRSPMRPRLLWVSSAQPLGAADLDDACVGIADAARALATDIMMIGRFPQQIRARFPSYEAVEWIEPRAYLDLLQRGPFIALAPLSLALAPAQQTFADCKSDIKIAQYGSAGVAGAYSAVPPYTESDLPCHIVPRNTRSDWAAALQQLADKFPDEGNRLAEHPAFAQRRPAVLAAEIYEILQQAAKLNVPFSFRAIATPDTMRKIERRVRSFRSRLMTSDR
jgi:hypothetical protein